MARKKKAKGGWKSQVMLVFAILAAALFLPTTFVLMIGMLPTPMAALVDRTRRKTKVVTVGAMNLAGCSPFLLDLWKQGHNFDRAFDIVTEPMAIVVMYSAAAIGYLIDWAMTGIVAAFLVQRGLARQRAIQERQHELVERWGIEVTGEIPIDRHGFPANPETAAAREKEYLARRG